MHCGLVKIGVMGSAGGELDAAIVEKCIELGRAIAEEGCAILTGGCPGLPHYAILGCKGRGRPHHWRLSRAQHPGTCQTLQKPHRQY
jgi:hypothetical protein